MGHCLLTCNQSYKVKSDYINHIKDGDYLPGLLDFIFSFLGHAQGKPLDVSKLDITTYTPDLEPPKRDTQWLLAHLYFLALQHVPSLTKYWWIDCKSRAIAVSVEPWTEKYVIYPFLTFITSELTSYRFHRQSYLLLSLQSPLGPNPSIPLLTSLLRSLRVPAKSPLLIL